MGAFYFDKNVTLFQNKKRHNITILRDYYASKKYF